MRSRHCHADAVVVVMSDETPAIRDIASWCKAAAREGANRLHASASVPSPPRTETEEAARQRSYEEARARLEEGR